MALSKHGPRLTVVFLTFSVPAQGGGGGTKHIEQQRVSEYWKHFFMLWEGHGKRLQQAAIPPTTIFPLVQQNRIESQVRLPKRDIEVGLGSSR